jgi:hypothetical protein
VDPITIIALVALIAGAGAGGLAYRRGDQRKEMREAVRAPIASGDDLIISLFDVFWDLGASEFTLEMLAHRGLLLERPADLSDLLSALPQAVAEHGSYKEFVDDLLLSIQEYRECRRPADKGRLLASPNRKLLPLPKSPEAVDSENPEARQQARVDGLADTLIHEPSDGQEVDIDQVLETDALDLIGSLFAGAGTAKVKRWFGLRDARKLHEELESALVSLHSTYVSVLQKPADGLDHLYHQGKRWDAEVVRVRLEGERRSWRKESWAPCADALMSEAQAFCAALASNAREDTSATLSRIDKLAAKGDTSMAGYLVYLNRYAFFAGKLAQCEPQVRGVETATHKLRQELRECRSKGLI